MGGTLNIFVFGLHMDSPMGQTTSNITYFSVVTPVLILDLEWPGHLLRSPPCFLVCDLHCASRLPDVSLLPFQGLPDAPEACAPQRLRWAFGDRASFGPADLTLKL